MAVDINAYCKVCGAGYHMCLNCSGKKYYESWRSVADKPSCYIIYSTIALLNADKITIEQAYKDISSIEDLDLGILLPDKRKDVERILSYKESSKQNVDSDSNKTSVIQSMLNKNKTIDADKSNDKILDNSKSVDKDKAVESSKNTEIK